MRKIFLILLLFCFLGSVIAPKFVYAELTPEEQAERDANLVRIVIGLAGLALLTYMLRDQEKHYQSYLRFSAIQRTSDRYDFSGEFVPTLELVIPF